MAQPRRPAFADERDHLSTRPVPMCRGGLLVYAWRHPGHHDNLCPRVEKVCVVALVESNDDIIVAQPPSANASQYCIADIQIVRNQNEARGRGSQHQGVACAIETPRWDGRVLQQFLARWPHEAL
eukprot:6050741-Prymnesium_polylepis.3